MIGDIVGVKMLEGVIEGMFLDGVIEIEGMFLVVIEIEGMFLERVDIDVIVGGYFLDFY